MTDYSFFKCKYLSKKDLRAEAEKFREQYWPNGVLPVNMEEIIEAKLDLDIEPLHGISELINIDAYLKSDISGIVVDYKQYMDNENRYERRLRFSFAHETGHYVLHDYIFNNFNIDNPKDYYDFIINAPKEDYRYFEYQANEFAGRLLVPKEELIEVLGVACDAIKEKGDEQFLINTDKDIVLLGSAPKLCRPFGVSEEVIIRRVREEGLLKHIK